MRLTITQEHQTYFLNHGFVEFEEGVRAVIFGASAKCTQVVFNAERGTETGVSELADMPILF